MGLTACPYSLMPLPPLFYTAHSLDLAAGLEPISFYHEPGQHYYRIVSGTYTGTLALTGPETNVIMVLKVMRGSERVSRALEWFPILPSCSDGWAEWFLTWPASAVCRTIWGIERSRLIRERLGRETPEALLATADYQAICQGKEPSANYQSNFLVGCYGGPTS